MDDFRVVISWYSPPIFATSGAAATSLPTSINDYLQSSTSARPPVSKPFEQSLSRFSTKRWIPTAGGRIRRNPKVREGHSRGSDRHDQSGVVSMSWTQPYSNSQQLHSRVLRTSTRARETVAGGGTPSRRAEWQIPYVRSTQIERHVQAPYIPKLFRIVNIQGIRRPYGLGTSADGFTPL